MTHAIPVVDVFAGCGGLGEGFNALKRGGEYPFDVRLSIEKDIAPIHTLRLRSFYHQFRGTRVPDGYYEYVSGKIDRDELFRRHPVEVNEVQRRCLQVELGSAQVHDVRVSNAIKQATANADHWVLNWWSALSSVFDHRAGQEQQQASGRLQPGHRRST